MTFSFFVFACRLQAPPLSRGGTFGEIHRRCIVRIHTPLSTPGTHTLAFHFAALAASASSRSIALIDASLLLDSPQPMLNKCVSDPRRKIANCVPRFRGLVCFCGFAVGRRTHLKFCAAQQDCRLLHRCTLFLEGTCV